jgi:DNA polymerase-3 subunit alpha (Gram-positive type)
VTEFSIPREFVVLDFETSGLSPGRGAEVVETGAVRVVGRSLAEEFDELSRPSVPIPGWATAVHAISNELVATSPHFLRVLPDLLAFLGEAPIVAHNAAFDRSFLDRALRHQGLRPLANPVLDSVALSRGLFPEIPRHDLNTLCHWHGIRRERRHRALDDARATAEVLIRILNRAEERGVNTWDALRELGERSARAPQDQAGPILLDAEQQSLLEEALVHGECVEIRYFSRRGSQTRRSVVPYSVDAVRGVPRLVAYDVRRGATQSFRLDRVREVVRLEERS